MDNLISYVPIMAQIFDFVSTATEPLPAKAGRFGELLKQPKGSAPQLLLFILLFSNFKVVRVTSLLQILVLDILFDYFIRHVSATCHKISSRP